MLYQTTGTFLETIANFIQRLRDAKYMAKGTSLIEASQANSVNPILIIDESLSGSQYLPEMSAVVQNMFAAYYLSAASLMTKINNVKISEVLGPLNPSRAVFESKTLAVDEAIIDLYVHESVNLNPYKALPVLDKYKGMNKLQALKISQEKNDTSDVVKEYSPLSVGRIYDVDVADISEGKQASATVKVLIQLLAYMIRPGYLTDMLTFKSHQDMAMPERWFNFKIGKIGWMDLLFQKDLMSKHRNMIIKDKTGLYREIVDRKNRSSIQGLISGRPSLAAISNIALISKVTANGIEDKLNGPLSKYNVRNQAMENTGLMILGVVDMDYERVTFYFHTKELPTVVSFKDFKLGQKGNQKLEDMLAMMVNGSSQRF